MKIAAWLLLLLVMRVQAEGQTPTTPSESILLRTSEWLVTPCKELRSPGIADRTKRRLGVRSMIL